MFSFVPASENDFSYPEFVVIKLLNKEINGSDKIKHIPYNKPKPCFTDERYNSAF